MYFNNFKTTGLLSVQWHDQNFSILSKNYVFHLHSKLTLKGQFPILYSFHLKTILQNSQGKRKEKQKTTKKKSKSCQNESLQRLNREHFYSSIGNSLFERSYNETVDSPLTWIALEMTVVIIVIHTRLITIQRK